VRVLVRSGLGVLVLDALIIGGWNQLLPESFYEYFPTVSLSPPFSEHFARDFGGAMLGIGAVLVVALVRPKPEFVGIAALAFSVFAVPHFVFHSLHLEHASLGQAIFLQVANALVALIGIALGIWSLRRLHAERRPEQRSGRILGA
jgi:hypothetical protein